MTKKLREELERTRENIFNCLFMWEVICNIGPLEAGKIVTRIGHAPNVEKLYKEERQHYMLNHFYFGQMPTNSKGEIIRSVPEVDDGIIKIEPYESGDEEKFCPKRFKKIHFIYLSNKD